MFFHSDGGNRCIDRHSTTLRAGVAIAYKLASTKYKFMRESQPVFIKTNRRRVVGLVRSNICEC